MRGLLAAVVLAGVAAAVALPADTDAPGPAAAATEALEVPPPPFSEGIYPCSMCHADLPVDRTRRELGMHDDIELRHDEEHRWCLDCHDATDRDWLHLASGERVPFEESYRLCGQCHGEKLRDWRAGVHGRRTGSWNGHKKYLLCAHCHNPHAPRFQPLAPKPAPESTHPTGRDTMKPLPLHPSAATGEAPACSRRQFASIASAAAAGFLLTACGPRRLTEMPKERLRRALDEMEREYRDKRGVEVKVSDTGPMPDVVFGYALDLSRCVGCRRCVYACVEENNQSRDPQIHWIRVLAMEKEKGVDFAHADPYYDPETVPEEGHFYVPVACQQCRNPPCVEGPARRAPPGRSRTASW